MGLIRSLSGRLLLVTMIVVMLAEVAIFVPSVSRFREAWLIERVRRAEIAALTVLAAPDRMVSPKLEQLLIENAEVLNVVVRREGMREMVLMSPDLGPVGATYDLRERQPLLLVRDALWRLYAGDEGIIRIRAFAPEDMGRELEITVRSAGLAEAVRAYGLNILFLSLAIALSTAIMVFFAMRRAVVRPVTIVIENLKKFAENPEDTQRIIEPKSRVGEIAEAERAVADMQREVQSALSAKARLAALGEAVAKISHDLRNILAKTQLMADRLETSSDPIVGRTAPKLLASLDRAIRLCQSTLAFGKAEEAPPDPRPIELNLLACDVVESLGLLAEDSDIDCEIAIPEEAVVEADPEQLYRVLINLVRNAAEAIRSAGRPGTVRLAIIENGSLIELEVADTGPGMPSHALDNLFKPFKGGARRGGTGLGLAIAHELTRANRGELRLISSTSQGTVFRLALPGSRRLVAT
ncbi:MAG: HAMP domain-containing sensor histidine kinase [Pseudomonadota bacterium]